MSRNPLHCAKRGQAMTEFVMIVVAFVLLVSVTCDFIPIFTASLRQQTEVHSNMGGISMLDADEGMVKQRSGSFEADLSIPFMVEDADVNFSETVEFPAANLKSSSFGAIDIPGGIPAFFSMENENDDRTSKFKSWIVPNSPRNVKNTIDSLMGSAWVRYENIVYENHDAQEYVYIYTMGDPTAPSAVAAVYVGPSETSPDKLNPISTTVAVIARLSGGMR